MPAYGTVVYPGVQALTTGQPAPVFTNEVVSAGTLSVQVVLPPNEVAARSYSVEFFFTDGSGNPANPGAFELDIMHADTDKATHYVAAQKVTSGLNASFVGRAEMIEVVTKFIALQLVSVTNSVHLTAYITK